MYSSMRLVKIIHEIFWFSRFFHLVESIEVRENVAVTEDHIAEFDKDTGGVIRLHSIP